MPSVFACPACGHRLRAKQDLSGKKVRCKGCSAVFRVEGAGASVAAGSEAATLVDAGAGAPSDVGPQELDAGALRTLWEGTVESAADPGMTIQSKAAAALPSAPSSMPQEEGGQVASDVSLPVQSRFVIESGFAMKSALGRGGMGAIYRAEQESLQRPLAVKTILPGKADDAHLREKFIAEALVTGELDHPNIVPVVELGQGRDGTLFYAMKEVTGTSWQAVLPEQTERENLRILLAVCDAMAFAHDKGYVHRDLKPENVMLGEYGEVYVMDWGLAVTIRSDGHGEKVSADMTPAGTPAYMAPEMAACEGVRIGPWSDIYLLGGILYEIATGRRPHTGDSVFACLLNAAENRIQPLADEEASELTDIALTAMAAEPDGRYRSVADFQEALRGYLDHQESLSLTARAEEELAAARAAIDYTAYAKAVFGFEQAVELWEENRRAARGLAAARLAYAKAAHEAGDYDLALSQLDGTVRRHRKLIAQVHEAKNERAQRRRRLRWMTTAAALAGGLVVLLSVGAALWIRSEKEVALAAKAAAETALAEAEAQRAKAERTLTWLSASQKETRVANLHRELAMANPAYGSDGRFVMAYGKVVEADLSGTSLSDISPLRGVPLRVLDVSGTQVRNIEPLWGMPLEELNLLNTWVAELGVLHQTKSLRSLAFSPWTVGAGVEDIRGMNWLQAIRVAADGDPMPPAVFWERWDAGAFRDQTQQAYARETGQPLERTVDLGAGVALKLVLIPPGSFTMGRDETAHRVRITTGFYLGVHEVTCGVWAALVPGSSPPADRLNYPVANVSWDRVHDEFLPRLNAHAPAGMSFCLPTEAQWEYACRAGTTTLYAFGDRLTPQMANCGDAEPRSACPVGSYPPNAWGLYDMHGNVCEWCEDWLDRDYHTSLTMEDPVQRTAPEEAPKRVWRGAASTTASGTASPPIVPETAPGRLRPSSVSAWPCIGTPRAWRTRNSPLAERRRWFDVTKSALFAGYR